MNIKKTVVTTLVVLVTIFAVIATIVVVSWGIREANKPCTEKIEWLW